MEDYTNSKPLILVFYCYDDQRVDGFKVTYNSLSGDFIVTSKSHHKENMKKLLASSADGVILLFKTWWKTNTTPHNKIKILTGNEITYCYEYIEYEVPLHNEGEINTYYPRRDEQKLKITDETINIFKDYLAIIQLARSLGDEEKKEKEETTYFSD